MECFHAEVHAVRRGECDGIEPRVGEGAAESRCRPKRMLDSVARFASLGDAGVERGGGDVSGLNERRGALKKDARAFRFNEVCQPRANSNVADGEDGYLFGSDR